MELLINTPPVTSVLDAGTAIDGEAHIQDFGGAEIFQIHGNRGNPRSGVISGPLLAG